MSEPLTVPPNPQLSPEFDEARKWSRVLAVLFAIGYWAMLIYLIAISVAFIWPESVGLLMGWLRDTAPTQIKMPAWGRVAGPAGAAIFIIPLLFVFHYARRVFLQFAKGEVFTAATIDHIRATATALIVAGFLWRPSLLIVGVATYVAAYVMGEARRIADENASIV